jgi:Secretion system C-terminal sorting domain/FG-GAP repeat
MKKSYIKQMLILAMMLMVSTIVNAQWGQIGADIDGETGDRSGHSVSLSADGSMVAIGASYSGNNTGRVRIYRDSSSTWVQVGADLNGEALGDEFGHSVSLSADGLVVAIGAPVNNGNGSAAGHVRIYRDSSSTWVQIGDDIDGEAADDWSGYSVSLSIDGSVVAIGASCNDGNGSYAGHVRVYENILGTWTQIGVDIDGEAANDGSGASVSLSADGSVVAIGAYQNSGYNGDSIWSGHVRVYQNIAGTWTQIGSDIDGEAAYNYSGRSVSLSADGSMVAIGSRRNDGNGTNAGHVRVYQYNAGSWQLGAEIDGEAISDYSGHSVSLSADGLVVAIGAPYNDGNGSYAGHVRVYEGCLMTFSTMTLTACDSLVWIDGNTYYTDNNTATQTLTNAVGCDSIVSLNLTVNYTNTGIDTVTACSSLLSPSGNQTWSTTGTYIDTIPNVAGCDSVITIDFTIIPLEVPVTIAVIPNGITLSSLLTGISYQWIDCDNNNLPITGETNQSFTPTVNGNYAVNIDDGTCVGTSICYLVTGLGINDNVAGSAIVVYPNPTKGNITIECEGMERVEFIDVAGNLVYELLVSSDVLDIDISAFSSGVYFVRVMTEDGVGVERIILE